LLHLVGSSILLYLIDDARSNKNQVYKTVTLMFRDQLNSLINTAHLIVYSKA